MTTTTPINSTHAKTQFVDDPKVVAAAVAQGCVSVSTVDELPDALKYLDKMLPGLLFQHHSPDGQVVPQFRPDSPKGGPKYIFPKGSGSVLSVNPAMTLDRPTVVIVEGTKQAIFAAAYVPDDVLVIGVQGCWGWSFEGQALASLDALVDGKDVIVIFDDDVASNPDVYVAAKTLVETLEVIGAVKVTFAFTPGDGAVGLDDFLSRRPIKSRGDVFAKILTKSVPFTKFKKPAKCRKDVIFRVEGSDAKRAGEVEIARIFDAVASGEYVIAPKRYFNNGTQQGLILAGVETIVNIKGVRTDCIALVPKIVREITGCEDLALRLDAFLIRDNAGRRTRPVRIRKETVRCVVITKAAWKAAAQTSQRE